MKVKKPTTPEEVEAYELEVVQRGLIQSFREKGNRVIFGGFSEDEYHSYERIKKLKKVNVWDLVSKKDKARALGDVKKGDMSVKLELPPVIFNSSAAMQSGVAYLNVTAVSWLNKEPQALQHGLLSLMRKSE